MADNYLQPVSNHFDFVGSGGDDFDDVDDDIFLTNSRTNSTASGYGSGGAVGGGGGGGGGSGSGVPRSTNPFEEDSQAQLFAEKRRQIEARSLESTQKSLGLLYETEDVGKATAVELAKQREQLEKTSRQLDEINSTLRFSQRHLNGLKSVFGGLKNYLSGGNRDGQSPRPNASSPASGASELGANGMPSASSEQQPLPPTSGALSPSERYDQHPVSRLRDDSSAFRAREDAQLQRRNNPFEAQLEANLEEMCGNLSRLKNLATDMGSEIETQNELLDNMNYKIEDVDLKMTKQNKDMNKLLGKK